MPFCSASPRSKATVASTGGARVGRRRRALTTRASRGNRRLRRSSHSFSSSAPAPAPKRNESHSPDSSAAASSAGSRARKAPASSVSTSAAPRHLYLEVVGEEGFVQLLNLDVVFLGVQKTLGQFLERLFHRARFVARDPEVHHDFSEVAGVVEGSEDGIHLSHYQLET